MASRASLTAAHYAESAEMGLTARSSYTMDSLRSSSGFLGLFLKLVGGLFILFANFVELPHVLKEVGASLERDEKLGLLAVASVVRGLNCDGLGSDFLECGIVVPKAKTQKVSVHPHIWTRLFKLVPIGHQTRPLQIGDLCPGYGIIEIQ